MSLRSRLLVGGIAALSLGPALHAGIIAYDIPVGTAGTRNFGNSLGMDFYVHDAAGIDITDVGVFDSLSDGINGPLNVAIYDRRTNSIVPGSQAGLNGTDGTAMGGHRFIALSGRDHAPGYPTRRELCAAPQIDTRRDGQLATPSPGRTLLNFPLDEIAPAARQESRRLGSRCNRSRRADRLRAHGV